MKKIGIPLAVVLSALLSACGGSSSGTHTNSSTSSSGVNSSSSSSSSSAIDNQPVAIEIPFEAFAGNTEINCAAELTGLGTVSTGGSVADFRFYVHNLRLITDENEELLITLDDSDLQTDNIALLDFRDKLGSGAGACQGDENTAINKSVTGSVTIGTHVIAGLRFTLGVPATHNHSDQTIASDPLKSPGLASGMNWGWNVGYKFTGIDIFTDVGISRPNDPEWTSNRWNVHLGSTGCVGDAISGATVECANVNRPDITLDGFVVGSSRVKLDYAALVARSNLGADEGGPAGCMSGATDPECAEVFVSLGMVHALNTTDDPASPPEQSVFSLVND